MDKILPILRRAVFDLPDGPVACELTRALEDDITVGDYVTRNIKNYNFTFSLDDNMYEHEVCHPIIGMAALKLGTSAIPGEYGYNGSWESENIAIAIQLMDLTSLIEWQRDMPVSFEDFYENAYMSENFNQIAMRHEATMQAAWALAHQSGEPTTMFRMRHKYGFETRDIVADTKTLEKPADGDVNKYGETYRAYQKPDKEELREFYDTMIKPVEFIRRKLRESGVIGTEDARERRVAATNLIKSIRMRDLYDCMADTPQTIYRYSAQENGHILSEITP